jgi:excisionase family DNA binding protein
MSHLAYLSLMEPKLLRPSFVARQLGVSRSTIYRWFWEGRLRGVKLLSGIVRIWSASVEEQLADMDPENLPSS